MKDVVVVFARAPRLGAVKRRLAREIGARAALRFHVATLTGLTRALVADRRYRTVLAITPDRARLRLPVRVTRIPQGSGHLGVRMHRAFRRFPRCRVALIGSDIPDAAPTDVWAAFRALGSAQVAACAPGGVDDSWPADRRQGAQGTKCRGGTHRQRHSRCGADRCVGGISCLGQRTGRVRSGGGRRILAGGAVVTPPGAAVHLGTMVERTCAGRHAGEFRWAADRDVAHAA